VSLLYLDASAITKLVIEEAETASLQAFVSGEILATARVAVIEVGKAVARANPEADARPILARFAMVELDAELASTATGMGGASLRALDALHVASALRLGPDLEAFVTYDARQADAARLAGLRIASPGVTSLPRPGSVHATPAARPDE
jgi:hypothetical protein